MGPERQVPGDDDEPHHEGVGRGAGDREPRGRDGGHRKRRGQRPERHEHSEEDDELVGAGERAAAHA